VRNQRFWYAAAAATVLLAAGCNGGADNQPSPTPTPTVSSPTASPSDSGSPSPSASVSIPAEAMAQTPEGAVAFVKFYYDRMNAAWSGPQPSLLEGLSTADCGTCSNLTQRAKDLNAAGQKTSGPASNIVNPVVVEGATTSDVFVDYVYEQQPVSVLNPGGAPATQLSARTIALRALLHWRDGRWYMAAIGER